MSICTDSLNEARRDLAEVLEELGAVAMHLREAMNYAEMGGVSNATASVDDAQSAIDNAAKELSAIREKAGRWAIWAEEKEGEP